jgi:prevent-host-death family protein
MQHVTLDEAKTLLDDLMEAATRGEEVFISKEGRGTVQLVPRNKPERRRQFGSAQGMFTMSEDFDDPLPDLEVYRVHFLMKHGYDTR